MNGLSAAAIRILSTHLGFRCETLYGAGVRDISEVVRYETTELRNSDIYLTCRDLYGISLDLRKSRKWLNEIVLYEIERRLKTPINQVECLWVCSEAREVVQVYNCRDIDCIEFKDTPLMVVSDMGREGGTYSLS